MSWGPCFLYYRCLVPDVRGMHGPKCNVKDLTTVFATKEQGGILEKEGARTPDDLDYTEVE